MKHELTEKERIKAALLRQRVHMRQERYAREFSTIYNDNLCPICHHRHMAGVICRKHRGSVCMRHCMECEHHEQHFGKCMYREKEPIDMRKWKLIYGCANKEDLWWGIYRKELLKEYPVLLDASKARDKTWGEAYREMEETFSGRTSPKYAIKSTPDENGDYAITDTDTGEIQRFVAKFLGSCGVWACVEYLPAEA